MVTDVAIDLPQKTHFPVCSSGYEQVSGPSWLLTRESFICYLDLSRGQVTTRQLASKVTVFP